ncbi:MAG: hypothetical protein HY610_04320, partial [Elusimicrobia bacterium]|nr:hypothetical protein [Elusimicrobiota bacterium]
KHVPPSASQEIPLSDFGTEEVRLQLDGNQPSLISVPGGRKTADTEERLVLLDEEGNPVVTNTVMKTVTVNLAIDHVPNLLEGESEDSIYGGIMFLSTLFGPEGAIGALDFTTLFPDIRRALNGEITWDQIRGEIIFVADSPDSDFSEAKFDFLTERLIGGNFVTKKVRAITTQMDQPGREIYSLAIKDLFYAGVQRWGTLTERKIDFERVLGFTLVLDASIVPHTDVRDELGNVTQVPNKSLLRAAFAIDGAAHTEEFVLSEPVNANDLTVFNPPAPEIEVRTPTDHVLEDMGRTDGALVSVWSWLADTTEKQAEGNPLIMWSDRAESNEAAGRSHQDVTLGIRRKSGTATGLVIRIQDVPPEGHIPNIATVRIKGLTNISQRLDLLKGLFERANPRIHFEPEVDEFGNLVPGGYGAISRRLYVLPHSWEFFSDAYQEINEEGEIVQVIPTPVAELELLGVGWDSVIVIEPTDRMKAQAQPFQPTTKEVDLTQPEGLNQISFEYLKGQVESLYPTAPEGYQRTEGGILVPSPRSELRQPAQPKKVVSQPKRIILPSWLATTFAAGLPVTSVAPRIAQTAQLVTRAAQVAAPKLVKAAPQIAILCSLSATSCTTGLFDELGAARGGVDLDSYSQYDETRDAIILTPLPSHVAKQLAKQMALQAKQTGLQTAKHVPPSASQEIPLSDFGTEEVRLQLDGNQPSLISVPGGRKTADTEER